MATTLADAYMRLRVNTDTVEKDMVSGTTKAASAAGAQSAKHFSTGMLSGLKGLAGAVGATFSLAAGAKFFGSSVAEAREAAKVGKLTESVIKSTGSAARLTADEVGFYASQLSNLSGVDDEVIQNGENMLLTFTNIKKGVGEGNDIFQRGTEAALNMSVAMGTDMQTAAIQVGKALNDPIQGVGALRRVGVQLTDQQEEQVKAFVKSGDIMSAQKIILNELATEFGGAAAAAASPADKAAVAWGNFKETIGTALLPVLDKVSGFMTATLIPALGFLLSGLKDNQDASGEDGLAGKMFTLGKKIRDVVDTVIGVVVWFREHKGATELLVTAIGAYIVATKLAAAAQIALNLAQLANPVGIVIVSIVAIVGAMIWLYNNVKFVHDYYDFMINSYIFLAKLWWESANKYIDLIVGAFKAIPGALTGLWDGLVSGFKAAVNWIIDTWNNLELTIGGGSFAGVSFPSASFQTPDIPRLAAGGTVKATPGGVLAILGEGGRDERITPLGPGSNSGGNQYTINVNVPVSANKADVGRSVVEAIQEYEIRNTASWRA